MYVLHCYILKLLTIVCNPFMCVLLDSLMQEMATYIGDGISRFTPDIGHTIS